MNNNTNIFELLNSINYFETNIVSELHKPTAIIFDWYGTIIQKKDTKKNEANEYLKYFNIPYESIESNNKIDFFTREYFDYINQNKKSINNFCIQKSKLNTKHINILVKYEIIEPNVILTLLNFIKKNNIFCGIISNKDKNALMDEICAFELDSYFDKVIAKGDSPSIKPMVDPMVYMLSETNLEFGKNIWFIGDSDIDMEFGNVTLSTSIRYSNKKLIKTKYENQNDKKYKNYYKDFHDKKISSMSEILDILKMMF